MERWSNFDDLHESAVGGRVPPSMVGQQDLFRPRVGTIFPGGPGGADIAFMCEAHQGGIYFCKEDRAGRPARATDWIGTHLAQVAAIATPECAVVEDPGPETHTSGLFSCPRQPAYLNWMSISASRRWTDGWDLTYHACTRSTYFSATATDTAEFSCCNEKGLQLACAHLTSLPATCGLSQPANFPLQARPRFS